MRSRNGFICSGLGLLIDCDHLTRYENYGGSDESNAIARSGTILVRDGIDLDQHIPIKSWAALQKRPIGAIATFKPITIDTDSADLLVLVAEPDGPPIGIVTLHDVLRAQAQITDQF